MKPSKSIFKEILEIMREKKSFYIHLKESCYLA